MKRTLFAILLAMALPARAETVVLPLDGFVVDAAMLGGRCDDDSQFQGADKKLPMDIKLRRAVCLYHASGTAASNERAIELVQDAQKLGLGMAAQNFAALLEGLLHCREARLAIGSGLANGTWKSAGERIRFCSERRQALASFGDVLWQHLLVSYAGGRGSLEARLDEMAACYGEETRPDVLSATYDPHCDVYAEPDEDAIAAEVQVESARSRRPAAGPTAADVARDAFDGSSSQLYAMFQKKMDLAKSFNRDATQQLATLRQGAGSVRDDYNAMRAGFDGSKNDRDALFTAYHDVVLDARTTLEEFQRWSRGLLVDGNDDYALLLSQDEGRLGVETSRLTTDRLVEATVGLAASATSLIRSREASAVFTRRVCEIYYCELVKATRATKTRQLCGTEELAKTGNPLCQVDWTTGAVTGKVTAGGLSRGPDEICGQAQMPAKWLKAKLSEGEAKQCFTDF